MEKFSYALKLMRIEQWIKNVFIFFPLFFSGGITNTSKLIACIVAFLSFCFIASSIYCFNDILDVESDKIHPEKSQRPLANGKLSKNVGIIVMIYSLLIGTLIILSAEYAHAFQIILAVALYYLLNVLYTLWLKHKAIIDVIIIALGFVIRIVVGGIATDITLSHWIIIMTFLIALFIAFAKRRDDFVKYDESGVAIRKSITNYNFQFLDAALVLTSTITIVAYIMYTISPEVIERMNSDLVYTTSIFVLMGILRYLQLTLVQKKSWSPTKIVLKDRFIQCDIALWIIAFVIIMYL